MATNPLRPVDTDPGVDDVIALLYAIASPEVEILAVIATFGNSDLDASYTNLLKTFQIVMSYVEANPHERSRFPNLSNQRRIILARGPGAPVEGESHHAEYFHGQDGLGDITTRHPEFNFVSGKDLQGSGSVELATKTAVDVGLDLLREYPAQTITYLTLGPLTNLALMIRQDGKLVRERIGKVVCMGGALEVPGNTSPVAEFNFYADPYAAKELLCPTGRPPALPLDRFLLVPLDLSTPHELPFPTYRSVIDSTFESTSKPSKPGEKTTLTHFTSSFLEQARDVMLRFGKDALELHDVVALWCAIENPPLQGSSHPSGLGLGNGWKADKRNFDIERIGEITRGMVVVDRREDESAFLPLTNRSEETAKTHPGQESKTPRPALVEIEFGGQGHLEGDGVWVMTDSPGPSKLLQIIFDRIWGVIYDQALTSEARI